MKRLAMMVTIVVVASGSAFASSVSIYVDAAPNKYGSPDYSSWEADAFAAAADGTFVNMSSSVNPNLAGTTKFDIRDEVVYSFGDLGKRLTWIYWVPDATISDLQDKFKISLLNTWDGDDLDFYDDYYGSTWLEPTTWQEYDTDGDGNGDGVIGTAGMAWWGAYEEDTQEALDADIAAWQTADETWLFTVKYNEGNSETETSLLSTRAAVPEPLTMLAVGSAVAGLGGYIRRRRRA